MKSNFECDTNWYKETNLNLVRSRFELRFEAVSLLARTGEMQPQLVASYYVGVLHLPIGPTKTGAEH